jgi:KipI family sensor histidine kinase inhibitor
MTTVRSYGDRALLVDCSQIGAVNSIAEALRVALRSEASGVAGDVEDVVVGATSVAVRFTSVVSEATRGLLWATLDGLGPLPTEPQRSDDVVVIPVTYDGADLDHVAAQSGQTPDAVVAIHTSADYTVAFCGFRPGFAYLTGLDPALHLPRHGTPRTAVPAGSVAIAERFSGVYPARSPGGWQLLGRTDAVMWHTEREPPALLRPGMTVRFTAR